METDPVVTVYHHPVAEVFDTAADPEKQAVWEPETLKRIEKLTPGPLGQGSRYRGKFKGMGTVEYEFPEYEPPKRFAHRAKVPFGVMRHIFTFEETPEGTRMTQVGILEPNLLGRVMTPVMARMMPKRFHTIATALGRYLDRQA